MVLKYDPWTNSISFIWNFPEMQILGSRLRPTESETLDVGPALCFNKLSGWKVHTTVWEPLSYEQGGC